MGAELRQCFFSIVVIAFFGIHAEAISKFHRAHHKNTPWIHNTHTIIHLTQCHSTNPGCGFNHQSNLMTVLKFNCFFFVCLVFVELFSWWLVQWVLFCLHHSLCKFYIFKLSWWAPIESVLLLFLLLLLIRFTFEWWMPLIKSKSYLNRRLCSHKMFNYGLSLRVCARENVRTDGLGHARTPKLMRTIVFALT